MGSTKVDTLSPAEIRQIHRDSLNLITEYTPRLAALDTQLAPQLNRNRLEALNRQTLGDDYDPSNLQGLQSLSNRAAREGASVGRDITTQQRIQDVDDAEALSGRVSDLVERTNPELFGAIEAASGTTALDSQLQENALRDAQTYGSILSTGARETESLRNLRDDAIAAVGRGGALSAEQLRNAQQASRQADNSRGLFRSSASSSREVLNTDRARRENLAFEQNRLAGLEGLITASTNRTTGILDNFNRRAAGASDRLAQRTQQNINNRLATFIDPFQGAVGRQAINSSASGGQLLGAAGQNASLLRPQFQNDFNALSSGLFSAQQNANIATANNNAGILGGLLGGIGGLFGG